MERLSSFGDYCVQLEIVNIFASKNKRTIIGGILKELNLRTLCILYRQRDAFLSEMVFDNHCHPIIDRLYTQLRLFVTVVYG